MTLERSAFRLAGLSVLRPVRSSILLTGLAICAGLWWRRHQVPFCFRETYFSHPSLVTRNTFGCVAIADSTAWRVVVNLTHSKNSIISATLAFSANRRYVSLTCHSA